jgi:hypothetical protein
MIFWYYPLRASYTSKIFWMMGKKAPIQVNGETSGEDWRPSALAAREGYDDHPHLNNLDQ